jgi:hypothetical protein
VVDGLLRAVGQKGHADGSLLDARFDSPSAVSMWEGRLIVAEWSSKTIRMVDPVSQRSLTVLMTAVLLAIPKELIGIIADYAGSTGVCTIAGNPERGGVLDGHALREAAFYRPSAVAMDESDPVAGPALIIADHGNHSIRSLNLRTEQVGTLVQSRDGPGYQNGPADQAQLANPVGLAVSPTGVIFVAEQGVGWEASACIRRISSGRLLGGRHVTTVALRVAWPRSADLFLVTAVQSVGTLFRF